MSDVTFMRGYGFPRGSKMDFAGLRGFSGMLVNNRPRQMSAAQKIPFVPEPSIFQTMPAMDGLSDFGTEYDLPVLGPDGEYQGEATTTYGPEYRPDLLKPSGGGKVLGMLALGAGLLWFLGR